MIDGSKSQGDHLLQDVANALEHTLDLPSILPHGARVDPTADGFLLQLPTCELPFIFCLLHVRIVLPLMKLELRQCFNAYLDRCYAATGMTALDRKG